MPEYVKVAQASELEPNHGKLVEVQGKKVALFNLDGKLHAIDNTCTHRGGPTIPVHVPLNMHWSLTA
jgi:nitrite reductase/ring-hydroxylating ferredoxin subunit